MLACLQARLNLTSPMARREALTFYALITPWLLGFIIFLAYPMGRSLYLSFTNYSLQGNPVWIGLSNYERIFADPDFWQSLKVTFIYALGSVPGGTLIALVTALVLAQKLRGVNFWRTVFFLPSVLSSIAVANLWLYVFRPEGGLLNLALGWFGIDGANVLQIIWHVFVPLSKAAIMTVIIFTFWWTWNSFLEPLIYLNSPELYPVSLGLNFFKDQYGTIYYDRMIAASVLSMLPLLLIFFFAQRYFIEGIQLTGMKG